MRTLGQLRRYHRALVAVFMAILIAALVSIQLTTAVAADVTVNIVNFTFQPTPLTIPVGTTVIWTNQDTAPHTATSDTAGIFDTGMLQKGQSAKVTFNAAGTYAYHCSVHPNMHGTVVVTAAGAASPSAAAPSAAAPSAAAPSAAAPPAPAPAPAPAPTATTAPPAPPRTGEGGEALYIQRLGDG
jgi:plastocyanin